MLEHAQTGASFKSSNKLAVDSTLSYLLGQIGYHGAAGSRTYSFPLCDSAITFQQQLNLSISFIIEVKRHKIKPIPWLVV